MDKIVDRILNSNANLEHPLPGIADKAALFMGKMVPPARYSKTNSSGQTVRPVSIAVERRDTRSPLHMRLRTAVDDFFNNTDLHAAPALEDRVFSALKEIQQEQEDLYFPPSPSPGPQPPVRV